MSRKVEVVGPDQADDGLRERMRVAGIHHLVVVYRGELLGVVSSRDLERNQGSVTVAELMSRDPICGEPRTTVRQAANRMRGNSVGCLPVVEDGEVVGVVTVSDLLEMVGRGVEKGRRRVLSRRGPRRRFA